VSATEPRHPIAESPAEPIDTALYRLVMGSFLTGVTVITAVDDGTPVGLAASSFTSVSMHPPLVLFCAGSHSSSWPRIQRSGTFGVNILADEQQHVSKQMSSKVPDKFADVPWRTEVSGSPILDEALAWIDCSIESEHVAGDHIIVVGRVLALGARDGAPLAYFRGHYGKYAH
jgi:3-hydroxy-9,10-secoandrosta-1,3,5(10)-triene-9,17-dione monooxygenase reductase component